MARARGSFEVTLTPAELGESAEPADGAGSPDIMCLHIDKRLTGGLEGTSRGMMLGVRTAVEGSAGYVAMETVTGTLEGRQGTFVLQHSSTMRRGEPDQHIIVVPDSATGELEGLSGEMAIRIEDGKHLYELEYALPEQG